MSQPIRRAYTPSDTGAQEPVPLDWLSVVQATIALYIVDGSAEYSIEATLDDVNDPDVTPRWFILDEFPIGSNASKYATIFNPWLFARVNFATITGNVELKIQQAFMHGAR